MICRRYRCVYVCTRSACTCLLYMCVSACACECLRVCVCVCACECVHVNHNNNRVQTINTWAETFHVRFRLMSIFDSLYDEDSIRSTRIEDACVSSSVNRETYRQYDVNCRCVHSRSQHLSTLPSSMDVVPMLFRSCCQSYVTVSDNRSLHLYCRRRSFRALHSAQSAIYMIEAPQRPS